MSAKQFETGERSERRRAMVELNLLGEAKSFSLIGQAKTRSSLLRRGCGLTLFALLAGLGLLALAIWSNLR